jgi:hypothetical protein
MVSSSSSSLLSSALCLALHSCGVLPPTHAAALPMSGVIKTYNLVDNVPPTSYDFFAVPFYVPAGVAEISVQHTHIGNADNILDWGLADTRGANRARTCDAMMHVSKYTPGCACVRCGAIVQCATCLCQTKYTPGCACVRCGAIVQCVACLCQTKYTPSCACVRCGAIVQCVACMCQTKYTPSCACVRCGAIVQCVACMCHHPHAI